MCGRTGLSLSKEQIQCACSFKSKDCDVYQKPDWLPEHNVGKDYIPSYNITPTEVTPVLISSSKFKHIAKTNRALKPMMWGIIPPWHKGDYKSHNLSTNNCRIENIKTSKLYGPILSGGGRCIIIAEGFYEWQTTVKSKIKQPFYIYAPQDSNVKIDDPSSWNNTFTEEEGWRGIKLLHMAGLYHTWQAEGTIIYSYSVITMESNNTLDWLHHRMPAILDTQEQIEAWLDIDHVDADKALSYLNPVKLLTWHQVSTVVNNSKNKSDNCNKRIESKTTQKTLKSFFTKSAKRKSTEETSEGSKKIKTE
ncbi:abasic site processing protein HMCES [Bicyclus anynana]|uniref:Abasic site processing protein HMCES n=1 Tax=Bicyclus anynana TaxID=110368 RepID=A0ABM3LYW7_BICAN|nr:abasic site processing protein HMCES [Bicyclus anynana]